ncbi:MAG: hypothetical protein H0T69_17255 [Thermoleophilaceae bacterium]|nr:hypothetical protein [Thermoleophilaceae bacterium]
MIGGGVIQTGWSVVIAVVGLGLLLQNKVKVSEPVLVAVAAVVGLVAFSYLPRK